MRFTAFLIASALAFQMNARAADDLPWQKKPEKPTTPERPKTKPTNPLEQVDDCDGNLSDAAYRTLAQSMSGLASNQKVKAELAKAGLDITNVSWQDTGRYHNSTVGGNISDVRLVAITKDREGKTETFTQPIVRLPNFQDVTVDIDMDQVFIPVGNAVGVKPYGVSLKTVLEYLPLFTSSSEKIKGSLFSEQRDSKVLVSAQAAILPVTKQGEAHFVPSIYNYQSTEEHPAVLVILVSNRGTSVTVIDNQRDKVQNASGQMLFHNKNGEKAPFVIQSLKEVSSTKEGQARIEDLKNSGQSVAGQSDVNQVMMIQVPLKHPPMDRGFITLSATSFALDGLESAPRGGTKGLDKGVVDVAKYTLGKFVELNGLGEKLERDHDLPIRVDVIKYMASDTTDLTAAEVRTLPEELRGIYEAGSNIGSLVTGDQRTRITRNYQPWQQPWWPVILPYIPRPYRPQPIVFLEKQFGAAWVTRFANEESALQAVRSMETVAVEPTESSECSQAEEGKTTIAKDKNGKNVVLQCTDGKWVAVGRQG